MTVSYRTGLEFDFDNYKRCYYLAGSLSDANCVFWLVT